MRARLRLIPGLDPEPSLRLSRIYLLQKRSWRTVLRGLVTHTLPCSQVMSFFHYSRKCDKRQLSLPIEPLAGPMRHPFVIPACNPPVRPSRQAPLHDCAVALQFAKPVRTLWLLRLLPSNLIS